MSSGMYANYFKNVWQGKFVCCKLILFENNIKTLKFKYFTRVRTNEYNKRKINWRPVLGFILHLYGEIYKQNFKTDSRLKISGPKFSSIINVYEINESGVTHMLHSVALVRTRTIPTERLPPVGEVSANFCG